MKLVQVTILLILSSCGSNGPGPDRSYELYNGGYRHRDGSFEKDCFNYYNNIATDGLYWIDPDQDGINEFKAYCDMSNGGKTVFEKNFNYSNATNQTIEIFNTSEIGQLNQVRNISNQINISSDLNIRFYTDSAAGGCGGGPNFSNGDTYLTSLSYDNLSDNTITTRNFIGSSDNEDMIFDSNNNYFTYSFGFDCSISTNFGINTRLVITSVKLITINASRAYSRLSGTFYKVEFQ